MRRLLLPVLLVTVPGLTACGSEGPIPFEQFCSKKATALCDAAKRCGCMNELTLPAYSFCTDMVLGDCEDEVEVPVNGGLMTYDENKAGLCLAGLKSNVADCALKDDDYPEECDTMLMGSLARGTKCEDSDHCEAPMECRDNCILLPGEGEGCYQGWECRENFFCDGMENRCRALKDVGGDCQYMGDGVCLDELYCDGRNGVCAAMLKAGESCDHAYYGCDEGLYCPYASVCTPYPEAGEACNESNWVCADGSFCSEDGICEKRKPTGAECRQGSQCETGDCEDEKCAAENNVECPFL